MGWTGPYPVLSRKRPTADLVSRKVLTPLLGHIFISVLIQVIAYKTVQSQSWLVLHSGLLKPVPKKTTINYYHRFKAPQVDLDNSNIENSENTALFLTSSFQYIFASVVLSVGPPFRMRMSSNSLWPDTTTHLKLKLTVTQSPLSL